MVATASFQVDTVRVVVHWVTVLHYQLESEGRCLVAFRLVYVIPLGSPYHSAIQFYAYICVILEYHDGNLDFFGVL